MPDVSGLQNQETEFHIQKELASNYVERNIYHLEFSHNLLKFAEGDLDFADQDQVKEELKAVQPELEKFQDIKVKIEDGDADTIREYFQLEIERQREENEKKAKENNK